MKKRSIIVFTLVIALVVSLSVGCGSKTPKEILEDAILNSAEIKSSQQKVELDFSLDMETSDPMLAGYLEMFKDISLVMDLKTDSESKKSVGEFTFDLNGMVTTVDLFVTSEHIAFKLPMAPQYVVQELDTDEEMDDEAKQEMGKMLEEITKAMLENIEDEKIVNNGDKTITVNENDVKVTEIAVEMSNEEVMKVLEVALEKVFENPQMREYFAQSYKTAFEAEGIELTDEELEEAINEMKEQMSLSFEEMKEFVEINDLTMTFFIDNKSNIRKTDFEFDVIMEDVDTGETITMEINGTTDVWNINEELEMDIPEFDEENSITLDDFINQMFGFMPF